MSPKTLLIIEDDPVLLRGLKDNFEAQGYLVRTAKDGQKGLDALLTAPPDLLLLDLMLPKVNGYEICRTARSRQLDMPIIMLTARADEMDRVVGLEIGADDYVTKPFGGEELLARVRAVLRSAEVVGAVSDRPPFTSGDLKISFAQRQVTVAGREVKLTPTEFGLLQELTLNAGKVLTHTHLLQKVWGPEYRDEKEYLHEFVRRLRNKLEPDKKKPSYIVSVPSIGYQFRSIDKTDQ